MGALWFKPVISLASFRPGPCLQASLSAVFNIITVICTSEMLFQMSTGNLQSCVQEWLNIGAPEYLVTWIKHGAPLLFIEKPASEKLTTGNRHFTEPECNF